MKTANVANPAPEHSSRSAAWSRARALLAGTSAMRSAGETFLPKFKAEEKDSYQRRLSTSVLFGAYAQAVKTMTGLPFAKPVMLGDDVPARIREIAEDIDQRGTHLDVFARRHFQESMGVGAGHILVDMDSSTPLTAADDLKRRARWVFVGVEDLIDAHEGVVGGRTRYTHVRIRERVREPNGYSETIVDQIREIAPPLWRTWRLNAAKEWVVHGEGVYGQSFVTMASMFAGDRSGTFTCDLPLENLSHLNIALWQSQSDQRNILTFSRFGILAIKSDKFEIDLGPHTILFVGPEGGAEIVEHSGAAISAGERDVATLKAECEAESVRMLTRRPGTITATENAIDESKDQSELEAIARTEEDCLELALEYTALWMGEATGGSLAINKDFGIVGNASAIKDTVLELRRNGDLGAEDALKELQRAGLLSQSLDLQGAAQRAVDDVARTLGLTEPSASST